MQWYKILAIVIGSFLGVYIGFLLLVALEYPQRQYSSYSLVSC
jgi:formate-dependent nitrite reductase membrane component NrfD